MRTVEIIIDAPVFNDLSGIGQALEPPVFLLQAAQPLRLADFHSSVFRLPPVDRSFADPLPTRDFSQRAFGFDLLQYPDDLLLAKSTLFICCSFLGFYPQNSNFLVLPGPIYSEQIITSQRSAVRNCLLGVHTSAFD